MRRRGIHGRALRLLLGGKGFGFRQKSVFISYLSIYLSIYLSMYLSIYMKMYIYIYVCIEAAWRCGDAGQGGACAGEAYSDGEPCVWCRVQGLALPNDGGAI